MKILEIGTSDKRGGAATVGWQLKQYLTSNYDCQVKMFVADKTSQDSAVKIIKRNKLIKLATFLFNRDDLFQTDWILKTKEFQEADLIHCHNLHGRFFNLQTLIKISAQKPLVWTLHDEWAITPHCAYSFEAPIESDGFFPCRNKNIPPRLCWGQGTHLKNEKRKVYTQAKINVVVPSQWLKDRVVQSVLQQQPLSLIYNGVDTDIFQPTDKTLARQRLNLPLDKKIIFFIADAGKINPWKGWEYTQKIIDNLSHRSDLLFLCAGNDQLPENNRANIRFLPLVKDQKKLAEYYSASDVLLYSSVADNFPLVILEAMACGLPIASFDTGGIKEVLTHQTNGYLAPYRDGDQLQTGVEFLLSLDQNQQHAMAAASRQKIITHFKLEQMIKNYYDLYCQLIKK